MEFRLLGPTEVEEGGRPIPLRGHQQRSVLVLLLLSGNQIVSTDRLVDAVWGERPPPAATNTVQQYVHQLRKLVGPERILTRPNGYELRLAPGELDVDRFELLLRGDEVHEALRLWRGPPLADVQDEEFAQLEIRRLDELRLAALERRVELDLGRGQGAELVAELKALVAQSPYREQLRRQLMIALYRSGRQAEALESYREARAALVEGLGIEPGPALQELERSILRHDESLELSSSGQPRAGERPLLVVASETSRLPLLLGPAEALAQRPERELLLAVLLPPGADAGAATRALAAHRAELAARGRAVRVVAYGSASPGGDAALLAREQNAALVLVDAPELLDGKGELEDERRKLLDAAPCDVGLLASRTERLPDGPVVAPFGGAEHEWSAVELAAWIARNLGVPLRLAGAREADRDAGRLLARASLAVQAAVGVVAEPLLVEPGLEGMSSAARGASLLVVGLPEPWRLEGLGAARTELTGALPGPFLFVRRGDRPGVLAPPHTITRFSWTKGR